MGVRFSPAEIPRKGPFRRIGEEKAGEQKPARAFFENIGERVPLRHVVQVGTEVSFDAPFWEIQ